ncbi:MAG TPA: DEAD/DEAH box helicase [Selenomonadales bacterium]|nr:DEAD/DEAH box helicase [Selenomonadales bacterium]
MLQLRPYQEIMVDGARMEFQRGIRRTCIVAPCGAGKTVIMADMASKARVMGNRTLFVVHRQELIRQSSKTFSRLGISHGIVAADYPMMPDEYIQVASIQTVVRRVNRVHAPTIIIIDEAHHSTAATWRKLMEAYPDAFVVGLTATPARMGGQGLGDIFESLIMGPTAKQLIAWGNLAPYKYFAPPVRADLADLKVLRYGDYDQKEVAMRMDRSEIIGDQIEQYQKLAPGAKAICYCASIAQSQHTAEMFRQAGIPALHIDGDTHRVAREAATEDFKTGRIRVLCNVDLISEGYDIADMDAVILARPTQSLTLYIQQAMRAMRQDPDNPEKVAVIIDAVGNVYRHGLPDDDREWSLESKKKKSGVKPEIPLKVCPQCYGAHKPGPVCEICGYRYPGEERAEPEQRAGELAEILELEKKRLRQEIGRARDVVTLEQIAMQRGYRPGWILKQCELKNIPLGGS